jgi:hypothetical protein
MSAATASDKPAGIVLTAVSRRFALVDAPALTDSKGKTFYAAVLLVEEYADDAVAVTISGQIFDEIGPVDRSSSIRWLDGERFAGGIAKGIPALATAPGWVVDLVEDVLIPRDAA